MALSLLASYLTVACKGDVKKRDTLPGLIEEIENGGHAKRVMKAYEDWFKNTPELEILFLVGIFDRPADDSEIEAIKRLPAIEGLTDKISKINEMEWKYTLENLRRARLLSGDKGDVGHMDCHPLVREYFGKRLKQQHPKAWKEGNYRLYKHFKTLPEKELPDSLQEMVPLYRAVYHGCEAQRHQEVLKSVYDKRISRGDEEYHFYTLGSYGSALSALANYFERPWSEFRKNLGKESQAYILGHVGYAFRSIGRVQDSISPLATSIKYFSELKKWKEGAKYSYHLSNFHLLLGEITAAVEFAEKCRQYAEIGNVIDINWRKPLSDAWHQAGFLKKALALFDEEEKAEQKNSDKLYASKGYRYCHLLINLGKYEETIDLSEKLLNQYKEKKKISRMAGSQLTLGIAKMLTKVESGKGYFKDIETDLTEATKNLERAGKLVDIPIALTALAQLRRLQKEYNEAISHLEAAFEIANDSEMNHTVCDIYLEGARLVMAMVENKVSLRKVKFSPRGLFAKVAAAPLIFAGKKLSETQTLVDKLGYGLKKPELLLAFAKLKQLEGNPHIAREKLSAAVQLFNEMGYRRWDTDVLNLQTALGKK